MNKPIQVNRIKETLMIIINSFVFGRLFYCSSIWSNTSATNIHKLQLVQNFAARIILGLRKCDQISAGLRSLRWLNVKQRLMVNDAVMKHKCLKGLSPSYLSDKFSTRAIIYDRQTGYRESPRGGGDSHMKQTGMLVMSLRGVNFGFWSRSGCSG